MTRHARRGVREEARFYGQAHMRRDGFLLSALSMGLIYCSISFGLIVINLRGSGRSGGDLSVLFHFVLALLVGLGLYRIAKKSGHAARPMPFAVLAAATGLFCVAIPMLPGDWPLLLFNGKPPMINICAALFMPVGLTLFFRAAPAGREGFFYGLVMAAGEVLWTALFPLFDGTVGDLTAGGTAFHLFTLNCLTMGGAGLCLGAALYTHGEPKMTGVDALPDVSPSPASRQGTRTALLWIFGASAGMFILMGLETGMSLPKTALAPGLIALPHIAPLFFLPVAGRMLDGKNPGRLMLLLMPLCLLAPLLGLAQTEGRIDTLAVFCLLSVARQTLLLAALTVSARLLKRRAALPLMLTLAHCLYLTQLVGALPRKALAALPYSVEIAALALALGAVFCLWRFRSLLTAQPELWELSGNGEKKEDETANKLDPEKIHAFASAHNLTGREQDILRGLIHGASREDIGQERGLALRTVRYHLTGLLKKTATPTQQNLLDYYTVWKP